MRLRVLHDGTRPDVRLCNNCIHAQIVKGPQQGQELVYCNGIQKYMAFPVVECNAHAPLGEMQEWEAKRIGWVLEVKAGKVIGFKPPKKEYNGEPASE